MANYLMSDQICCSIEELLKSSELKYKAGDYKGSILNRRSACSCFKLREEYRLFIQQSKTAKSKYDLIKDYKSRIDENKKKLIIDKLETKSEYKYNCGDYKGSIIAARRAEKYY